MAFFRILISTRRSRWCNGRAREGPTYGAPAHCYGRTLQPFWRSLVMFFLTPPPLGLDGPSPELPGPALRGPAIAGGAGSRSKPSPAGCARLVIRPNPHSAPTPVAWAFFWQVELNRDPARSPSAREQARNTTLVLDKLNLEPWSPSPGLFSVQAGRQSTQRNPKPNLI